MRVPTISVTNLVKQIAREEFDSHREEIVRMVKDSACKAVADIMCEPIKYAGLGVKSEAKPDVSCAGSRWTEEEEQRLMDEIHTSIKKIARDHRRYPSSIRARLQKMNVITFDYHNPKDGD